jgi:VanZ family protein
MPASVRRVGFWAWGVSIAVVITLSVLPGPVAASIAPSGLWDKLAHGGAYFVLALLPGLLYGTTGKRVLAAAAMIALGGLLEIAQMVTPERGVELADAMANAAGAVLGWITAELILFLLD